MLTNAWVAIEVACLAALMAHLAIIVYNKEKQESTIADGEFFVFVIIMIKQKRCITAMHPDNGLWLRFNTSPGQDSPQVRETALAIAIRH